MKTLSWAGPGASSIHTQANRVAALRKQLAHAAPRCPCGQSSLSLPLPDLPAPLWSGQLLPALVLSPKGESVTGRATVQTHSASCFSARASDPTPFQGYSTMGSSTVFHVDSPRERDLLWLIGFSSSFPCRTVGQRAAVGFGPGPYSKKAGLEWSIHTRPVVSLQHFHITQFQNKHGSVY